jgi:hypothetical protein
MFIEPTDSPGEIGDDLAEPDDAADLDDLEDDAEIASADEIVPGEPGDLGSHGEIAPADEVIPGEPDDAAADLAAEDPVLTAFYDDMRTAETAGRDEANRDGQRQLARASFRVAAAEHGINRDRYGRIADLVDWSRFVRPDGEPDEAAITAYVNELIPRRSRHPLPRSPRCRFASPGTRGGRR